jgi:hypothetical protein
MTQPITKAEITATLSKLQSVSQKQTDALWDKNITQATSFLRKIPGFLSYLSETASAYIAARQFNKGVESLFVAIEKRPLQSKEVKGQKVERLNNDNLNAKQAAKKAMQTFFHVFTRRCEQIGSTDIRLNDKALIEALSQIATQKGKLNVVKVVTSSSFAEELNKARFSNIVTSYAKLDITSINPDNFDKKVAELVEVFGADASGEAALRQKLCHALNKKSPGEFKILADQYLAGSDNTVVAQLTEEMKKKDAETIAKLAVQITTLAGPNRYDGAVDTASKARATAEAALASARAIVHAQGGKFSDDAQFDAILDDENSSTTVSEATQNARKARAEFRKADEEFKALDKQLNQVVYPAHWNLTHQDVAAVADRIVKAQGALFQEIANA